MTITEQKAAELRKPFPKNVTGKLPKPYKANSERGNCDVCGGYHGLPAAHLDYVGHAATTDRLLAVDPSWSWEPFVTDDSGLPALDRKGNLWIRLTVCGVTRIGVGDGMSAKECIGDAIRNAAMRFGVALDLWSKDELEQTSTGVEKLRADLAGGLGAALAGSKPASEPPAPEPADVISPAQLKKLHTMLGKVGYGDRRDDALAYFARVTGTVVETSKALTWVEAKLILDDLERREKGEPSVLDEAPIEPPLGDGRNPS